MICPSAQPAPTPFPTGYYLQKHTGPVNYDLQQRFQILIGSLLYLMLGTRPDIAFTITQLVWYTANPSLDHFNWALYVCHYLVETQDYSLIYKGETGLGISTYTDSDWASNPVANWIFSYNCRWRWWGSKGIWSQNKSDNKWLSEIFHNCALNK